MDGLVSSEVIEIYTLQEAIKSTENYVRNSSFSESSSRLKLRDYINKIKMDVNAFCFKEDIPSQEKIYWSMQFSHELQKIWNIIPSLTELHWEKLEIVAIWNFLIQDLSFLNEIVDNVGKILISANNLAQLISSSSLYKIPKYILESPSKFSLPQIISTFNAISTSAGLYETPFYLLDKIDEKNFTEWYENALSHYMIGFKFVEGINYPKLFSESFNDPQLSQELIIKRFVRYLSLYERFLIFLRKIFHWRGVSKIYFSEAYIVDSWDSNDFLNIGSSIIAKYQEAVIYVQETLSQFFTPIIINKTEEEIIDKIDDLFLYVTQFVSIKALGNISISNTELMALIDNSLIQIKEIQKIHGEEPILRTYDAGRAIEQFETLIIANSIHYLKNTDFKYYSSIINEIDFFLMEIDVDKYPDVYLLQIYSEFYLIENIVKANEREMHVRTLINKLLRLLTSRYSKIRDKLAISLTVSLIYFYLEDIDKSQFIAELDEIERVYINEYFLHLHPIFKDYKIYLSNIENSEKLKWIPKSEKNYFEARSVLIPNFSCIAKIKNKNPIIYEPFNSLQHMIIRQK